MDGYKFKKLVKEHSEKIEKRLEEIKNINDIEEKSKRVYSLWWEKSQELRKLLEKRPESVLRYHDPDLVKYEKLIKELWELSCKLSGEVVEQRKSKDNNEEENKNNFPKKQKENNVCWECHKTKSEKWFTNQETGLEFCSQACNLEHNAELCEDCVQKCLKYEKGVPVDYQAYYRDNEKKIGILCFDCKQKQRKELEEELRRLQQDQEADEEELEKIKSLLNDANDVNDNKNQESRIKNQESRIKNQESRIKNQESRIKNQESRIKNQLQTFQSNSIQSVELTNQGDLVITYQSNSGQNTSIVKNEALSPALVKVKENMVKNGTKKLTKEELEKQLGELEQKKQKGKKEKSTKDSVLGMKGWAGIGVVAAVVVVLGVIMVRKRKNSKNIR